MSFLYYLTLSTLILLALLVIAVIGLRWKSIERSRRFQRELFKQVEPMLFELELGRAPDPTRILDAVRNPMLRVEVYGMLLYHKRLDLYPMEFLTWESMMEGDMVRWLGHPNELGRAPDEMELMATVSSQTDPDRHFFVYRFRMRAPHWLAKDGWLAGVAGPHNLRAEPTPGSKIVFSRFELYDGLPPAKHVERAVQLINHVSRTKS